MYLYFPDTSSVYVCVYIYIYIYIYTYIYGGVWVFTTTERVLSLTTDLLQGAPLTSNSMVKYIPYIPLRVSSYHFQESNVGIPHTCNTIILFEVGVETFTVSSRAILACLRSILPDSSSLQCGVPHAMPNLQHHFQSAVSV